MPIYDLIDFLKRGEFTDEQGYNLLTSDLFDAVPEAEIAGAQHLVTYFMGKIKGVCFPAIRQAKESNASH